jgi:hypothetical protein
VVVGLDDVDGDGLLAFLLEYLPKIYHVVRFLRPMQGRQGRSCLMEVVSQDTIGFLQHSYTSS